MRFLLVKTSALGDIVHAFSVVDYLKALYPDCEIDWVVEKPFSELLEAHPCVHRVFSIESKKWRSALFQKKTWKEIEAFRKELKKTCYDIVFDFQGNMKSAMIVAIASGKRKIGFSWRFVAEWPNLFVTSEKGTPPEGQNIRLDLIYLVKSALGEPPEGLSQQLHLNLSQKNREVYCQTLDSFKSGDRFKIMVCPGSQWPNKQLSVDTIAELLESFIEDRPNVLFLFVWGCEKEKEMARKLHSHFAKESLIVDRLPLPVLQNVMTQMDLVIAVDSLPLHLAGVSKTPTLSVFGPSLASKYQPIGEEHIAFQGKCPYGLHFTKRCPYLRNCKTGACLKNIKGNEIFDFYRQRRSIPVTLQSWNFDKEVP